MHHQDNSLTDDLATLQSGDTTPTARRAAQSAQHRAKHWHPDAMNVDAETWWIAFREGANWLQTNSAMLSQPMQLATELIVMLAQSHGATPNEQSVIEAAKRLLEEEPITLTDGYVGVRHMDVNALRTALKGLD